MTSLSGDPRAELLAARDGTIVADLSHNALLAITGDDATAFLQGQLTNDVEALAEGAAQWNGWCTAKGRLLATFLLLRRPHEYLLMLPAEIAAGVAKRLGMFVLRSKVKIADASSRLVRMGLAGSQAPHLVREAFGDTPHAMHSIEHDGATCVRLDERRFVIFADRAVAAELEARLAREATPVRAEAWEWTGLHAGIPTIVAATQEAFVPQMANFELVGGVSFRKGCYPGQEIVARTQYRGALKRRMALAHVEAASPPRPGDALYSGAFGDQAAGTVVQATLAPEGGYDLLVVAQIESLQARDLRLGSRDGAPLEVRDTPALAGAP